jgi:hypothetical protein
MTPDESYLLKAVQVFFGLFAFGLLSTLPLYWLASIERSVYLENVELEKAQQHGLILSAESEEPQSTFLGQLQRRKSGSKNWLTK